MGEVVLGWRARPYFSCIREGLALLSHEIPAVDDDGNLVQITNISTTEGEFCVGHDLISQAKRMGLSYDQR